MQFILFLIVIPIFVLAAVLNKNRRNQAARQAETAAQPANSAMREMDATAWEILERKPQKPAPTPVNTAPVHTEGKHPDEIAANKLKIMAYERENAELEETRHEIREMDIKKLRSAVIMSEILDRPVSLRRRG